MTDVPREAPAGPLVGYASPIDVDGQTLDRLLEHAPLVLLDLWAPWCGPCRAMEPTLAAVAEAHAGQLVIAKLDVDQHPKVAGRFPSNGIPTLLLFERGQLVDHWTGVVAEPLLEERLAPYLDAGPPGVRP